MLQTSIQWTRKPFGLELATASDHDCRAHLAKCIMDMYNLLEFCLHYRCYRSLCRGHALRAAPARSSAAVWGAIMGGAMWLAEAGVHQRRRQ